MMPRAYAYDREALEASLKEGDIIFQETKGSLTQALEEGQGSKWTHVAVLFHEGGQWMVAEANKKVMRTPLHNFISNGPQERFIVKRLKNEIRPLNGEDIFFLRQEVNSMMNRPYDSRFEWDDFKIYCSELIYKAYDRAFGIKIGQIQAMSDLNLSSPAVQRLIETMFTSLGDVFNEAEPVVTPVGMLEAENLESVFENL